MKLLLIHNTMHHKEWTVVAGFLEEPTAADLLKVEALNQKNYQQLSFDIIARLLEHGKAGVIYDVDIPEILDEQERQLNITEYKFKEVELPDFKMHKVPLNSVYDEVEINKAKETGLLIFDEYVTNR